MVRGFFYVCVGKFVFMLYSSFIGRKMRFIFGWVFKFDKEFGYFVVD